MQPATGRRLRDNPWLTLVSVTLGVIMFGIDGSVVAVANPHIGRDLHARSRTCNCDNAVPARDCCAADPWGVATTSGRRRIFLIGVVGFSLTSVAIGLGRERSTG